MNTVSAVNHYRSIWISDIHLGTRGCKADFLLDFLKHTESDYLYLVGRHHRLLAAAPVLVLAAIP